MKILIMGLPGAGKTTFAKILAKRLGAVHFNADEVRASLPGLGFSPEDRLAQATRMGWLCDTVVKSGQRAVADFVCPTKATREAFGAGGEYVLIFMNRVKEGRFPDTNAIFEPPDEFDFEITEGDAPEQWAEAIANTLEPVFQPSYGTALLVGRYQPFHAGHKALALKALLTYRQVCFGVRHTHGMRDNPFPFEYVKARIDDAMSEARGKYTVIALPNITGVVYGRDVGYKVEMIELDEETKAISATAIRRRMGI